jgi:hypothetical protein
MTRENDEACPVFPRHPACDQGEEGWPWHFDPNFTPPRPTACATQRAFFFHSAD